jgi:pyrroloquinoline quinone (PQQ) biosynthesis protein C
MTTPYLRTLKPGQALLFEQIVKRVAAENDVPVTAGGAEVLQEIGFAVGAMLCGRSRIMSNLSPEIDAMIEVWRKLERDAHASRRSTDWRTQPVSMLAAC